MSNPYAPPTTAAFVLHASELPSGIRRFRLDRVATLALVNRSVLWRAVIIFVVLVLMLVVYAAIGAPVALGAPIFLVVWIVGIGLGWLLRRTLVSRQVATYEVLASSRVVRRILARTLPTEILRPEVSRIVETRWGLWLLSTSPRRSLGLVRSIEGYADLRSQIEQWKPIEALGGVQGWLLPFAEVKRQGPRDVVVGTVLETDADLAQELATVRGLGADRGLGMGPVARVRLIRLLAIWVLLIVMFLAIWQLLQPSSR